MANVLSDEKKQQVLALGRLGWPLRRIEEETGVRRETSSAYLRAAGIAVRAPRRWGHSKPAKDPISDSKAAKETIPDSEAESKPAKEVIPDFVPAARSPAASSCEPHQRLYRARASTRSQREGDLPGPRRAPRLQRSVRKRLEVCAQAACR